MANAQHVPAVSIAFEQRFSDEIRGIRDRYVTASQSRTGTIRNQAFEQMRVSVQQAVEDVQFKELPYLRLWLQCNTNANHLPAKTFARRDWMDVNNAIVWAIMTRLIRAEG